MTILETYRKVLSGEVTQKLFLEQTRKNKTCAQWINPLLSYEDTVRILKNKGILTENWDTNDTGNLVKDKKITSINPAINFSTFHNAEETEVEPEKYHGIGNDSGRDNKPMHDDEIVREDQEGYQAALQDIKSQIENLKHSEEGGPAQTDINQLIVASKLEFGLDDRDMDALKKTVNDWWNQELGATDGGMYEADQDYSEESDEVPGQSNPSDLNTIKSYLEKNGYNEVKIKKALEKLSTGDEPVYRAFTSITIAPDLVKNAVQRIYTNGKKANILHEAKQVLTADLVNFYEFDKGWKYEFHCMDHDKKNWKKAQKTALTNLSKNPNYYTLLLNGIDPNKKVKRTDIPVKVEKNNFVDKDNGMKPVKGYQNAKADANKSKKETVKAVKGVKEMTTTPKRAKGIKGVMEVPGKEKKVKLKEALAKLVQEVLKENPKKNSKK